MASSQVVGSFIRTLQQWSCWRRVLFVFLIVNQSRVFSPLASLINVESWRGKESVFAWWKHCIHLQVRILPVKLNVVQFRHVLPACVNLLCADTWEYFVSLLHISLMFGSFLNPRWMIVQNVFTRQQFPSWQKITYGLVAYFLTSSFTVTKTEEGSKPGAHRLPLTETEKIKTLESRLIYDWTK